MITLPAIVTGIYETIEPKVLNGGKVFSPKGISYHSSWTNENPAITISQLSDLRYALAKFSLEDFCLTTSLMIFTRWWQHPLDFAIDIADPRGLDNLCRWLYIEALDGLRFGRTGKYNDSFRLRLSSRYPRNPQPSLYYQKSLQFSE